MTINKHAFFIPIEIDHLVVHHKSANHDFAGQLADFSLLPHLKTGDDCTLPRIRPNISEDLVSKPFEPTNDPLHSGIHLHWTLPKEFRRAIIIDDPENKEQSGIRYRPVPNRWLIERRVVIPGTNEPVRIDKVDVKPKLWILESDALSTKKENGSVAFPLDQEKHPQNGGPAYRYLGRVYTYEDWKQKEIDVSDVQDYINWKKEQQYLDDNLSYEEWRKIKINQNNESAFKQWKIENPSLVEMINFEQWKIEEDAKIDQAAYKEWEDNLSVHYEKWIGLKIPSKVRTYEDWKKTLVQIAKGSNYLESLTAFGYGEPLFAAYYPQARNVFGFHDDLSYAKEENNIAYITEKVNEDRYEFQYRITGWYSKPWEDPMQVASFKLWRDISNRGLEREYNYPEELKKFEGVYNTPTGIIPQLLHHGSEKHQEEFNWLVDLIQDDSYPSRSSKIEMIKKYGGQTLVEQLDSDENLYTALFNLTKAASEELQGRSILVGRIKNIIWGEKNTEEKEETTEQKTKPSKPISTTLKGIVKNNSGPIMGATIEIKDLSKKLIKGTTTDLKGNFELSLVNQKIPLLLVVKYLGYSTKTVEISDPDSYITINFKEEGVKRVNISGTITDKNNNPIPVAQLVIENDSIGTVTDFDGNFSLQLPVSVTFPSILVISHSSYFTIKTKITAFDNVINLKMYDSNFTEEDIPQETPPPLVIEQVTEEEVLENEETNTSHTQSSEHEGDLRIVLANSPGQALAALLADGEKDSHNKERMLDALQLGMFSEEEALDFPARLDSSLHEAGFTSVRGESRWSISTERTSTSDLGKDTSDPIPDISIEWSLQLQKLNECQRDSDHLQFQISAMQEQLYADWYKFMIAEYDFSLDEITSEAHVNKIREFLAKKVFKLTEICENKKSRDDELKDAFSILSGKIEDWNEENSFKRIKFKLINSAGPQYWAPNEPVLLFQGGGIRPDPRYQPTKERVYAAWWQNYFNSNETNQASDDIRIASRLETGFYNHLNTDDHPLSSMFPFQDGSESGWNPIMMDWEVELFPFTKPGDKDFHQKDWPYDSIVANYNLPHGNPDLRLQKEDDSKKDNSNTPDLFAKWVGDNIDTQQQAGKRLQTLEGRTLLTANAHLPFIEQLNVQLKQAGEENNDLIEKLNNLGVLSQSLGGFNQLLLMRKQILQLKVGDPLAKLNILKEFTAVLKEAIGNNNATAPLPSNLFLPIREGAFQIRKIRLIDCWGRTRNFHFSQNKSDGRIIISDSMRPPSVVSPRKKNMAYLPPRIVQPCRLNFRWLSAEQSVEAGSHVSDSPICGYILPNFLDKSIHIYDAKGKALWILGISQNKLKLKPPLGTHDIPQLNDLTINPYLKDLVRSMLNNDDRFLTHFIEAARHSTNANLSENYAQFDGMALLFGRPLALVRAKLNLELKGIPAVNNSWNARETEYFEKEHHVSESMGFDKLRFAVRLGEKNRVGDGFFAYYIDKPGQEIREIYSPYREEEPVPQENYWKALAFEQKWREVYNERLMMRQEELGEIILTVEAIEEEINRLENLTKRTAEEEKEFIRLEKKKTKVEDKEFIRLKNKREKTKSEKEELNRLKKLLLVKAQEKELLEKEEKRLLVVLEKNKDNIRELKNKHGFLQSGPGIYNPHSDLLTVSLQEDEIHLGILMDPRNPVHLTTGILPVKKVDIPPELFADAINNIQIAFLTTPVISPVPFSTKVDPLEMSDTNEASEDASKEPTDKTSQKFLLHYPNQKGYQWSWIQPESDGSWPEYDPDQIEIPPPGHFPMFSPQAIFEGWMKLSPEDKAKQKEEPKND